MKTFESALESWECVLFDEIILGTILGTIKDISIKTSKKWVLKMSSILKNDMFRREGSSGYHSFYGWLKVHWVCIFRGKDYQADRKMRLHNGHYILGISIFTIFWSLKVHVTLTKTRKWSKTCVKAIYCAFESWDIIFLIYEILGTIWVPYYGCIKV